MLESLLEVVRLLGHAAITSEIGTAAMLLLLCHPNIRHCCAGRQLSVSDMNLCDLCMQTALFTSDAAAIAG